MPPILQVNVDHVATLRQARQTIEPDPVDAALQAEQAGAQGITIHLREDRRHIQDRDLAVMRQMAQTRLNLEMGATDEMIEIACKVKPDMVTLVPEKREEVTTEGGLEVVSQVEFLKKQVSRLQAGGMEVSLFIDPEADQIKMSAQVGAQAVELHTGEYANAISEEARQTELSRLIQGSEEAYALGLQVNAGHGLTYFNIQPIAGLPYLNELNIGHSIVSRSIYVGMTQAVREMLELIRNA